MTKLILRIIVAVAIAIVLAIADVSGNAVVLQTLFTVLGIVFSISMSLLVSFSLSKVLKVGSINSIFYFLHKAAEPFNCLEQGNLA